MQDVDGLPEPPLGPLRQTAAVEWATVIFCAGAAPLVLTCAFQRTFCNYRLLRQIILPFIKMTPHQSPRLYRKDITRRISEQILSDTAEKGMGHARPTVCSNNQKIGI